MLCIWCTSRTVKLQWFLKVFVDLIGNNHIETWELELWIQLCIIIHIVFFSCTCYADMIELLAFPCLKWLIVSFQTVSYFTLVFIPVPLSGKTVHQCCILHSYHIISLFSRFLMRAQDVVSMHFASLVEKWQESDPSGWAIWMFDIYEDVSCAFILPARCIWGKKVKT